MTEKSFLNMPIEGQVYVPQGKKDQLTEDQVNALFAAAIGQRKILGICWTQYTPYFNDGEPCVFRSGEPYFAIEGAESIEKEYYDYGFMEDDHRENGRVWLNDYSSEFKRLVGERKYTWDQGTRSRIDNPVDPVLYYPILALSEAIANGSCNDVLLRKFGDHAQIIIDVKNNKVLVDEYDHD